VKISTELSSIRVNFRPRRRIYANFDENVVNLSSRGVNLPPPGVPTPVEGVNGGQFDPSGGVPRGHLESAWNDRFCGGFWPKSASQSSPLGVGTPGRGKFASWDVEFVTSDAIGGDSDES